MDSPANPARPSSAATSACASLKPGYGRSGCSWAGLVPSTAQPAAACSGSWAGSAGASGATGALASAPSGGWPGQITGAATRPGVPSPDGPPDAEAIAALGAEIALVHARLDHLQAQLSRLHGGPADGP